MYRHTRLKINAARLTQVNDRIITITLDAITPIALISVYAPPSERTTKEKEEFYKALYKEWQSHKSKGPVIILGDVNAKLQTKLNEMETGIGKHTFNPSNITLETVSDEVIENRQNLINFMAESNMFAANT